jgi:multidrug transporter EmrE-like cation transporter
LVREAAETGVGESVTASYVHYGEQTLDIGAALVAVVALLASLSGWGLLAALERFGVRLARATWTGAAGAVLAVSFLPFIGDGMDGGTRVSLALMHLAVAAVLIPGPGGRPPGREPVPLGVTVSARYTAKGCCTRP